MDIALFGISAQGFASSIFSFALREFESAVEDVVRDVVGKVLSSTTSVGLGDNGWFDGLAGKMFPVEALVIGPLLFAATIGAVMRQDMRRLARAWLVCLPAALIGGFAIVKLATVGLNVTDALSAAIQYQVSPDLGTVFVKVLLVGLAATAENGLLGLFLCCFFLCGAIAIWIELAVRSACIELAVFFMPLAFAGLVWPATAHWAKRMIELLAGLLLAKPVIVGTLCLGAQALTGGSGISAAVEGLTILLMATFAPMAVLKMLPMVETSAIAHLEGISHQLGQGPRKAMEQAKRAASIATGIAAPETVVAGAAAGGAGAAGSGGGNLGGSAAHLLSQVNGFSGRGGGGAGGDEPSAGNGSGHPLGPARPPALGSGTSGRASSGGGNGT